MAGGYRLPLMQILDLLGLGKKTTTGNLFPDWCNSYSTRRRRWCPQNRSSGGHVMAPMFGTYIAGERFISSELHTTSAEAALNELRRLTDALTSLRQDSQRQPAAPSMTALSVQAGRGIDR